MLKVRLSSSLPPSLPPPPKYVGKLGPEQAAWILAITLTLPSEGWSAVLLLLSGWLVTFNVSSCCSRTPVPVQLLQTLSDGVKSGQLPLRHEGRLLVALGHCPPLLSHPRSFGLYLTVNFSVCFGDKVSLCSPGWPRTPDPPVSAPPPPDLKITDMFHHIQHH